MAISPVMQARFDYLKELRTNNPVWFRCLIQTVLMVPKRPLRPIPHRPTPTNIRNYANNRAARMAHQQTYKEWKENFKTNRPITYWLTETMPKYYAVLLDKIDDKWYDVKDKLGNFLIHRSDRWKTGVSRWDYESADELMLQVNFEQYVEFVETVFAHRYIRTMVHRNRKADPDGEEEKKWVKIDKAAGRYPLLRWKKYRNKEYALQYLHQQMAIPHDGYTPADEIRRLCRAMCLYVWWTQVRPNRGESEERSGLKAFRDRMTAKHGDKEMAWTYSSLTKEEQDEYGKLMNADDDLEQKWLDEDTDMLVLLVKERRNLWT
jgi:hypothetical protein